MTFVSGRCANEYINAVEMFRGPEIELIITTILLASECKNNSEIECRDAYEFYRRDFFLE